MATTTTTCTALLLIFVVLFCGQQMGQVSAQTPIINYPESNSVFYGEIRFEFNFETGDPTYRSAVIHINSTTGAFNRTIRLVAGDSGTYNFTFDLLDVNATEGVNVTTSDNYFVPTNGSIVNVRVALTYENNMTFTSTAVENLTLITECTYVGQTFASNCTECGAGFNATAASNCSVCTAGLYGTLCDQSASQCRTSRCSAHGNCTDRTTTCLCDDTYFGAACSQTAAACAESRCNDRGTCSGQTTGCVCNATLNYGGVNCSACAGNFFYDDETGECEDCEDGFFGLECDLNSTECRAEVCNSKGTCSGGAEAVCECDGAYNGTDCLDDKCGPHGTGSGTGDSAGCTCAAGYYRNATLSPESQCVAIPVTSECVVSVHGSPLCYPLESSDHEDRGAKSLEWDDLGLWLPLYLLAPLFSIGASSVCVLANRKTPGVA